MNYRLLQRSFRISSVKNITTANFRGQLKILQISWGAKIEWSKSKETRKVRPRGNPRRHARRELTRGKVTARVGRLAVHPYFEV